MKKKIIITSIISLTFAFFASFVGFFIYVVATDPMKDLYKDRIEYPLAEVNVRDSSEYLVLSGNIVQPRLLRL